MRKDVLYILDYILDYDSQTIFRHCGSAVKGVTFRHRFHEVMAQRALMRAVPLLRENGNDLIPFSQLRCVVSMLCSL